MPLPNVLRGFVLFLALFPLTLQAQGNGNGNGGPPSGGGGVSPMLVGNGILVTTIPTVDPTRPASSGPYSVGFTIENTNSFSVTVSASCVTSGPVTCGNLSWSGGTITKYGSKYVTFTYTTTSGHGAAAVGLEAYWDPGDPPTSTGWRSFQVAALPTVTIQVPGSGTRAVVHNRQPIIRAFLTPNGDVIDSAQTSVVWLQGSASSADTVTHLARHNRRLMEWEVDSTRRLRTGLPGYGSVDSAEIAVKACGTVGGCTTVKRWVVLLNDSLPILGFTGMPLGTLNGGFSAGFGPGLSVVGAEIETGFATPAYVSMGAARSTGLVYSTRQSYPRALVNVDHSMAARVASLRLSSG